jgi:plasmid stability protein
MANLTISIDQDLMRRARAKAAEQGRSLSAVVGEFLEDFAGRSRVAEAIAEFLELASGSAASSGDAGRTWTRDDLYDRPGLR